MIDISRNKLIKPILVDNQKKTILELHWEWFQNRMKKKKKYSLHISSKKTKEYSVEDILLTHLQYSETELRDIITANPEQIELKADPNGSFYKDYEKKYLQLYTEIKKSIKSPNVKIHSETLKMILYAFGYDDFENGTSFGVKEWSAYFFFEKMNVKVCPYCNRQYIFTIFSKNQKKGRPELDHFFPKDIYPYLSCSIFNFIPSCHYCNHQKSDKINTHIIKGKPLKQNNYPNFLFLGNSTQILILSPYMGIFEKNVSFQMKMENNNVNFFDYGNIKVSINIEKNIPSDINAKISNSIEAFHLVENYNQHQIELKDLLKRYRNYARPKIRDILKIINKSNTTVLKKFLMAYCKIFRNQILGLPLGIGNSEYPLRKFKSDIITQLDDFYNKTIKVK